MVLEEGHWKGNTYSEQSPADEMHTLREVSCHVFLSAMSGHSKKVSYKPECRPFLTLNLPVPPSWPSQSPN